MLEDWMASRLPAIDWASIEQMPNSATRAASAKCLELLAHSVPNMMVSSADLSNSDKTDGFLKASRAIVKGDFGGGFLQAGVSELTMACICIGAALHGGIVAAMGTFFVFSDYMKPAVRMAALMEVPVKFIWTHDAFRVGEDGPTHEPVEQEAQIRLMEKLKNHSGADSVRVLRPADAKATTVCWQMAMENTATPTALILSRQNIPNLPEETDYEGIRRGAYIVVDTPEPDVVLIASGSEVSTLVEASTLLRERGIAARVVSVPSEGLFRRQSQTYQEELLPSERAFAYKMKLDAMKHQGERVDLTSSQVGTKLRADELLAQQAGSSRNQVQRYIRLTELIPELLDMVDERKIALNPAYELSFLKKEEQVDLLDAMDSEQATPSLSQAQRLKKFSQEGNLSLDVMRAIMGEEKKSDLDKVTFTSDTLRKYFPKSYTPAKMQETIIKLLEQWQKKRQRDQER